MSDSWTDDLAGPARGDAVFRLGRSEAARSTHLGVRRFGAPRTEALPVSFDDDRWIDADVKFECSTDEGGRRGWIAVREGGLSVGEEPGVADQTFATGVRAWWLDERATDGPTELVVDGPPLTRTPLPRVARPGLLLALTRALGPARTA